jgi:Na+/H+ antiporter NhaD/arsenite permease-like protein
VELDLVLNGGLEYFFQRAVCSCGGKWIPHFADPALMWKVLALATTFAGNLTIIGSVANMIVVESAREHLEIGFWDYAHVGIPITVLTSAAGILVLLVLH